MPNIVTHNLIFFIPMALAGFLLLGECPVAVHASKIVKSTFRAIGAIGGALIALLVLEALPVLI